MSRLARLVLVPLLALASTAWAKDEIIPTKGKSRDREGPPNPLHDVADDMDTASRRLREAKTDDTTQEIQQKIADKLDALIEAAQQQSQQPPQSNQGDSERRQKQQEKKPQPKQSEAEKKKMEEEARKKAEAKKKEQSQRPGIGRAGTGQPDGALHTDAEEWGNLPPAIRDQLLQTQSEGFPLKYRELLRRYYRDLAKTRE